MRWLLRLLVAAFVWQACCDLPSAQERDLPAKTPFPRVDAGMHHAVIRGLSTDAACTVLASGSDDKTIRLWSAADNRLIKTLRPPIGDGDEGKINSAGLAPDGRWLAAGGWTSTGGEHWVYIFDTETGQIATRLGPSSTIQHVAVSPDGKRVAAALSRGHGLRVWERSDDGLTSWTLIVDDANFQGQTATHVAFATPDVLYVTAIGSASTGNGSLRRYNLAQSNRPIRTRVTTGGRRPASVAISPDGQRIVVGFNDTSAIDIYEAGPLAPLPQLNRGAVMNGSLNAVTWSRDGKSLIAAGSYSNDGRVMIRIWGDGARAAPRDLSGPSDAIFELVPCGDRIAFASADPSIGFISPDGLVNVVHGPVSADMRGKQGTSFTLSPDGYRVRFGLKEGIEQPVLFDLSTGRLTESPEPPSDLAVADVSSLPAAVSPNAFTARLSGRLLQVDDGERARSLAIDPGGRGFVLGTDTYLRFYDQTGSQIWRTQAPGAIWGINIAKQRPVIVAASGDGTVRWYNIEGRELVALFVHSESKRWIAWTPSGYYMASAGGEELMGWHVNRGWTETADFFTAGRFRQQFYRPDIVLRVLADLDEDVAIKTANQEIEQPAKGPSLDKDLPPVVQIISPNSTSVVSTPDAVVEFKVRSPSSQPILKISARIDGRPVGLAMMPDAGAGTNGEYSGRIAVVLPPRPVMDVSIVAETQRTSSEPASITIFRPPPMIQKTTQPRLFALVIGVGRYNDSALTLGDIPGNDAEDVAAELKKQEGEGLAFEQVTIRLLRDSDATVQNIKRELQWLSDSIHDDADVALIYFSGHGASLRSGAPALLPADFDASRWIETSLSKSDVLNALSSIGAAKAIFLVDACHAGDGIEVTNVIKIRGSRPLDTNVLVNDFASGSGIIAFASSQRNELSRGKGRNSYFTMALKLGLGGEAAPLGQTVIFTDDLIPYIRKWVDYWSDGKQTPIMMSVTKPIPVAIVKRKQPNP